MRAPAASAAASSKPSSDHGRRRRVNAGWAPDSSVEPAVEPGIAPDTSPGSDDLESQVRDMYARPVGDLTLPPRGRVTDVAPDFLGLGHLKSSTSGSPSGDSKRRYSKPSNAAQMAAQANEIATAILNGDINVDVASAYASTARVAVSAMNIEVQRARLARAVPDLSLDQAIIAEESDNG